MFEEGATRSAIEALSGSDLDGLLILQVTFTDAAMTVAAATAIQAPLAIWAVPEPRLGGRLRLNAFCGLNLASHALSLNCRAFTWAYSDTADVTDLFSRHAEGLQSRGVLGLEGIEDITSSLKRVERYWTDQIRYIY